MVSYSATQKALHWATALLVAALFGLGWTMTDLPASLTKLQYYSWHKWAGVTVFMLTVLRLMWRTYTGAPLHRQLPRWMQLASTFNHAALYGFLLAVPLLGWLMSSAAGFPVVVFGLIPLPDLVAPDRELAGMLETAHKLAGWGLLVFLAVHIAAALYHGVLLRDGVLTAMLPGRRTVTAAVLAISAILLFHSPDAQAGPVDPWIIDPTKSSVEFEAVQMSAPVKGRFDRWTARIIFDPAEPAQARVRIEIDLASASAGSKDVDQQLASEPFFAVKAFPTAVFEAEGFRAEGSDRFSLLGRLTLKGIGLPVAATATIKTAKDPTRPGVLLADAQGDAVVRRLDFKIGTGEWEKPGVIANDVRVRFKLAATRPQ